jgi:hypothetical protein
MDSLRTTGASEGSNSMEDAILWLLWIPTSLILLAWMINAYVVS